MNSLPLAAVVELCVVAGDDADDVESVVVCSDEEDVVFCPDDVTDAALIVIVVDDISVFEDMEALPAVVVLRTPERKWKLQ